MKVELLNVTCLRDHLELDCSRNCKAFGKNLNKSTLLSVEPSVLNAKLFFSSFFFLPTGVPRMGDLLISSNI